MCADRLHVRIENSGSITSTVEQLLHDSLAIIFGGRPTFRCCWTYITATRV
jgi:hypothetical protein